MNNSHLIVYTDYMCPKCGQKLCISTDVYHINDYKLAQEYALVVNDSKPEMLKFEALHSQHIYTYDFKFEPIGVIQPCQL